MATIDNSVLATGTTVTTLTTASFTVDASANYVLVVIVDRGDGALTSVSACGQTCSALGTSVNVGARRVHMYGAASPSSGSQTGTLNGNVGYGDNSNIWMTVITLIDADTPADYVTASGTSSTPSVTVSNVVTGDVVIDGIIHLDLSTVGANQTSIQADAVGGCSQQAGADGGDMSWSAGGSGNWAMAGIRIPDLGGGGGGGERVKTLLLLGVG